jgi:hypothetical protein
VKRVRLGDRGAGVVTRTVQDAAPATVAEALDLAGPLAELRPFVGRGATHDVWEALATLGGADLALARALEPHIDAITILDQAGMAGDTGSWAVYAAERPGTRIDAVHTDGGWTLSGTKPWCSLAGTVTNALVTAWTSPYDRRLFTVSLREPTVLVSDEPWVSLGLAEIPSGDIVLDAAPAQPVGEAGWYLERSGFAWGGISVAACWYGGAVGVARVLLDAARTRQDDPLLAMHLGAVDARLAEARAQLSRASALVDSGRAGGAAGTLLAKRVRATVAQTAESVLLHTAHALGPAPLTHDAVHAKRVADLEVYVRQHHAERDEASLGRTVIDTGVEW